MHQPAAALTALLAALPVTQAGLYTKNSAVLEIKDATAYQRLIAKSNYTSIVEFYAPWCGHCQNLKSAYERVAKNLDGLAKVAAVDCYNESSKQLCGSMGVQGFPTLKIIRPSMKPGKKPIIEEYQGPRTATAIVEAVADKINNHVSRLTDKNLDDFLEGDKPKFVLFTNKGTTSALLRSVAIDYLDTMSVGQIRDKEKDAMNKFGVDKFPTLMLFPAKGKETTPIKFEGELNKKSLLQFLSQVGPPKTDLTPAAAKADKATKSAKAGKKSASTKVPAACPVGSKRVAGTEPESSPESSADTTSTKSAVPTPDIIPITAITTKSMLEEKCLQPKSYTCVIVFVPSEASERGTKAIESLSRLNTKYIHGKRHLFPFFSVPINFDGASLLRDSLKLESDVELIVVNARRGWWRQYEGDFGVERVESWIDAIRMGEGQKAKLPTGVVVEAAETPKEQSTTEAEKETEAAEAEAETKTPSPKTEKVVHEEL